MKDFDFDKRINRRAAQVTNLRIVNKLFESSREQVQEFSQQSPDRFFDCDNVVRTGEGLMANIEQLKKVQDIETRRQKAWALLEQHAKTSLPEVEELATHFYEEGIEPLRVSLKLRQLELIERWNGNGEVNMLNIIQNYIQ